MAELTIEPAPLYAESWGRSWGGGFPDYASVPPAKLDIILIPEFAAIVDLIIEPDESLVGIGVNIQPLEGQLAVLNFTSGIRPQSEVLIIQFYPYDYRESTSINLYLFPQRLPE